MNKKMILYGLILLFTLTLTLGAVSANDLANETLSAPIDSAPLIDEVYETTNDESLLNNNEEVLSIRKMIIFCLHLHYQFK